MCNSGFGLDLTVGSEGREEFAREIIEGEKDTISKMFLVSDWMQRRKQI